VHVPNHASGAESSWGLRNFGLWSLTRQGRFDAALCYVGLNEAAVNKKIPAAPKEIR
jgi:hypothetical protein